MADPYTSFATPGVACLFAYGSVPGVELIPYFWALLAWVVMAVGAIFLSPFTSLLRRIRRSRDKSMPNPPPDKAHNDLSDSQKKEKNTLA
jgi:hypothetical protein